LVDPNTVLPLTNITFGEVRDKLTALHFTKESLSPRELELLHYSEGLLRLADPEYYGIRPEDVRPA
jgi:hypothetical protein